VCVSFASRGGDGCLDGQVARNYGARLPDSKPVVFDVELTVFEDGEAVPGSRYAATEQGSLYYTKPLPVADLALSSLRAVDQVPSYRSSRTLGPASRGGRLC
jgi:hypothetical protein